MNKIERVVMMVVLLAAVLLAAWALVSRQEADAQPVTEEATLDMTEWWLAEVGGEAATNRTEPPIYLRFFAAGEERPTAEYGGFAGCNYVGGALDLAVEPVLQETGATGDNCPGELGAQEAAVLAALRTASELRLGADGRLQVVDDAGKVALVYEPKPVPAVDPALAGSWWSLVSFDGVPPLQGTRLTLRFDHAGTPDAAAGGTAGCNSYGAEIRVAAEGDFAVAAVESTAMACAEPEGVMAQEEAFLDALREAAVYRLQGNLLHLEDEQGRPLLTFARMVE